MYYFSITQTTLSAHTVPQESMVTPSLDRLLKLHQESSPWSCSQSTHQSSISRCGSCLFLLINAIMCAYPHSLCSYVLDALRDYTAVLQKTSSGHSKFSFVASIFFFGVISSCVPSAAMGKSGISSMPGMTTFAALVLAGGGLEDRLPRRC